MVECVATCEIWIYLGDGLMYHVAYAGYMWIIANIISYLARWFKSINLEAIAHNVGFLNLSVLS